MTSTMLQLLVLPYLAMTAAVVSERRSWERMAIVEGILGKDNAAHSARIQARTERFESLMAQPSAFSTDRFASEVEERYQSQDDIDVVQEKIAERLRSFNVYLMANEHVFGGRGQEGSVYIAPCWNIAEHFCQNARSLREKSRQPKELADQRLSSTVEINLFEDKKLQRVINVFGAMLANIEQETWKDPYWILAQFVRSLFEKNKVEEEHFATLSEMEQKRCINNDDKKLSGRLATKIGDMVGSYHNCVPMAIMFKVISDFFGMPCRVVGDNKHCFNLGLDQQGKWQLVDVAQNNFQGMLMLEGIDTPSTPLDVRDMYPYSRFSGNKACIAETHNEEQWVVDNSVRRMNPISVPESTVQIKHSKMFAELEGFLESDAPDMHKLFGEMFHTMLTRLYVVQDALEDMGDESRKDELLAEHNEFEAQVRKNLRNWISGLLNLENLYGPLVAWLESDPDRNLYLKSISFFVKALGEKYAKGRREIMENKQAEVHNKVANIYRRKEDWERTLHHYLEVVRSEPDDARWKCNLGGFLWTFDSGYCTDGAIWYLRKAVELSPDYVNAIVPLALILSKDKGEHDAAIFLMNKAIVALPKNRECICTFDMDHLLEWRRKFQDVKQTAAGK